MNPDKLLALVMRGRDFDKTRCRVCGWPLKQTVEEGCTTESCSMRPAPQRRADEPPSFSDSRHRDEFFTWLAKERPEMWEDFFWWCWDSSPKEAQGLRDKFVAWLFFDKDNPTRPRDLMAEWLRLDETVERFGKVKCSNCIAGVEESGPTFIKECTVCDGSGRVLAPWAREVKEG